MILHGVHASARQGLGDLCPLFSPPVIPPPKEDFKGGGKEVRGYGTSTRLVLKKTSRSRRKEKRKQQRDTDVSTTPVAPAVQLFVRGMLCNTHHGS